MNKEEKTGLMLSGIGIIISAAMVMDVVSIIGDMLALFTNIEINVRFFNSFAFRLGGILLGASLLLAGLLLYKKNSQ